MSEPRHEEFHEQIFLFANRLEVQLHQIEELLEAILREIREDDTRARHGDSI